MPRALLSVYDKTGIIDTIQSLEARIHDVEHRLLVESLNTLITATQK